jgi:hypothetical protein
MAIDRRTISAALPLAVLAWVGSAAAFPLTLNLGNSGSREFHFCRLEVSSRTTACGNTPACLQFDSAAGPIWFDVHRVASLAEDIEGTVLLRNMFPFTTRLSLVGDAALLPQLTASAAPLAFDLHGYWYPSGRRLLLLDLTRVRER